MSDDFKDTEVDLDGGDMGADCPTSPSATTSWGEYTPEMRREDYERDARRQRQYFFQSVIEMLLSKNGSDMDDAIVQANKAVEALKLID